MKVSSRFYIVLCLILSIVIAFFVFKGQKNICDVEYLPKNLLRHDSVVYDLTKSNDLHKVCHKVSSCSEIRFHKIYLTTGEMLHKMLMNIWDQRSKNPLVFAHGYNCLRLAVVMPNGDECSFNDGFAWFYSDEEYLTVDLTKKEELTREKKCGKSGLHLIYSSDISGELIEQAIMKFMDMGGNTILLSYR